MDNTHDEDLTTLAEQFLRFGETLPPRQKELLTQILEGSVTGIVGDAQPRGEKALATLLVLLDSGLRQLSLSRLAREAGERDGV